MNRPYVAKIVSCRYDIGNEMFVLNIWFQEFAKERIIYWTKDDFLDSYNYVGNRNIPVEEMQKTARMLDGRWVNLQINDDPDMKKMSPEEEKEMEETFKSKIKDTMDAVSEGLNDPQRQIEKALERVLDKERNYGKIRHMLLEGEADVES